MGGLFSRGVGFITGAISGVIVIESDGPEGEAVLVDFEREHGPLTDTLTIRSGSGRGLHRHFRHPGHFVKTVANHTIKLDVKGDKGYCVLPPSLHKSWRSLRDCPQLQARDIAGWPARIYRNESRGGRPRVASGSRRAKSCRRMHKMTS